METIRWKKINKNFTLRKLSHTTDGSTWWVLHRSYIRRL